jgi:membrane fusion protein
MAAPPNPLFRKEMLEHRADRLHGDVSIAIPVSWQAIGFMLLAALAAAFLFLLFAGYTRVEIVSGMVVPDRGIAPIMPTRPGIVAAVSVVEGQQVAAGAPLAEIRAEEILTAGGTLPGRSLEAVEQQYAGLAGQSAATFAAAAAEQARLTAQIRGLTEELASVDRQLGVQSDLVASAVNEVALVQDVARRGYISRRDVLAREETLMVRRQQLAQLQQLRSGKTASMAEARRSAEQARAAAAVQAAELTTSRGALAQRRADAQAGQGYRLTAPVAGTVTAVTARVGQAATAQRPLMTIVPANAELQVELYVPTRASGFVAPGQQVRLSFDAFPFQRFGTVKARVLGISGATIAREDGRGTMVPVYLATAQLERPWISTFGKRRRLLPGMTLEARIVTERQSLLAWLFEPLIAVRGR